MKETNRRYKNKLAIYDSDVCSLNGYDSNSLRSHTAKLWSLITKRGTFEMLIPLCCSINPVRTNNLEN
ncbi:MAG TPA: hypothetical protein VFM31_01365 [Nitrososphaeraceae archaeon]|nr:hypothetical protein [Nitrososphaeraceae archaeon]